MSSNKAICLDPLPVLTEIPSIPRDTDGPVFDEPWEAQVFAIAVALNARGVFTWPEWVDVLAEQIRGIREHDDGGQYYLCWLAALEQIVVAKDAVAPAVLSKYREGWRKAADRMPHGSPITLSESDIFG